MGFPDSSVGKKKNQPAMQETLVRFLGHKDPLEKGQATLASISWASLVAQMVKNMPAMQETQVLSLGWEELLEKGMATHSSILAQRIPWTEEPGGLQSTGSQRVRLTEVTQQAHILLTQKR